MQAVELAPRRGPDHRVDERLVAAYAVDPHDPAVARGDLDGLVEVLQRERHRVAEAVVGLGHVLGEAPVRQVALHAGRGVAVTALEPRVVLLVHDVAVDAGARGSRGTRSPSRTRR